MVELQPLPPEQALAFFRGKGLLESFAWPDVWQEEHARAFTVAKAMRRDILEDIRAAVDKALAEGTTLEQFKKELTPLLQAKGWWGKQEAVDPLTGEVKLVQLGSPRRLQTIFDVNLRTAYGAGRWERIEATKRALPFLRYVAVGGKEGDGRTRLQHREWHGTILPVDDPWWDTHYGPCGWRCRCTAQQLTRGMMERRGWAVTTTPPKGRPKPWKNPRTGEIIVLEEGIDPGFAYNVGKAHLRGLTPGPIPPSPAGDDQVENAELEVREAPASQLLDAGVDRSGAIETFLEGFGAVARGRLWRDPTGDYVPIEAGLFLTKAGEAAELQPELLRVLPLVGRTIREPDEIRLAWRAGVQPGTFHLVRRYLATWRVDDQVVAVSFEISSAGWSAASTLAGPIARDGVAAWRRPRA